MIEVLIAADKDGRVIRAELSGHAGYASKGHDIVCAAVSAVFIGALNCLDDDEKNYRFDIKEGQGSVETLKTPSNHDCTVLEVMKRELEDLASTYPNYIQYKEERK